MCSEPRTVSRNFLAQSEKVDLILLDINLPESMVTKWPTLRSTGNSGLAYVPIIAITANALKGDAEKALEAGCDVYMSKPIISGNSGRGSKVLWNPRNDCWEFKDYIGSRISG